PSEARRCCTKPSRSWSKPTALLAYREVQKRLKPLSPFAAAVIHNFRPSPLGGGARDPCNPVSLFLSGRRLLARPPGAIRGPATRLGLEVFDLLRSLGLGHFLWNLLSGLMGKRVDVGVLGA